MLGYANFKTKINCIYDTYILILSVLINPHKPIISNLKHVCIFMPSLDAPFT